MKESEVSYQMAFSKQELRRVVKEYPAREVKKGLENLYRKVEKHLCEEENLLQVSETREGILNIPMFFQQFDNYRNITHINM